MFGTFEVIVDGQRLGPLESNRFQMFFASVLLRGAARQRARLSFDLWPDSTERQARTNLRKLLHDLRRLVPDIGAYFEIGNDSVRWKHSPESAVDVLAFRNALSAGDLERAALLYRGDLLPDCYDDWILAERERLRADVQGVFERLAERAAAHGAHEKVIQYTRLALELDPSDETAISWQIQALRSLGNGSAAAHAYRTFAERQAREFGAKPSAELERLWQDVGDATPDQGSEDYGEPLPDQTRFVGRREELRALDKCWDRAIGGRPVVALVTGEPGIGKSRLALEFRDRVAGAGFATASTRAYEAAGRPSWGPVIELLRSPAIAGQLAGLDTGWQVELARLMPELDSEARLDADRRSGRVAQRHRLLDAIARAIAGDGTPRLLVVDDLQWCDTETIECIGFIVRSNAELPVLILGTLRPGEIGDDHSLAGLVSSLERERAIATIALEPFGKADTEALARTVAGRINATDIEHLWAETEGNPLFIVETLRAGPPSTEGALAIAPTMRAVLTERLKQASSGARRVIEMAAVFGTPFSIEGMCAALQRDEPEVASCIDELWQRRILREVGTRYDFTHDKLRDAALDQITPVRRRQLHKAVALVIARSRGTGAVADSAQLAAHFDQAGLVEQAVHAYREAGARAASLSAPGDAVSLFGRAVKLLGDLPDTADRDRLELDVRLALGSPLVAVKGYGSEDAHRLYERALALCRRLDRKVDAPILRGLGLARLQGCRFAECDRLATQLVDLGAVDPVALTEGHYLLGVSAFWQGRFGEAETELETALSSYHVSRQREHLEYFAQDPKAICLVRLALTGFWRGDPARARQTAREALATAVDIDHLMSIAYVLTYSAIQAAEAEDHGWLNDLLDEAESQWTRVSDRYLVVVIDAIRGWVDECAGAEGGVDRIVAAVARSRAGAESLHLTYALLLLARARTARGELAEAEASLREALAYSDRTGQHYLRAALLEAGGRIACSRGDGAEGKATFLKAASAALDQGAPWFALRPLTVLAGTYGDAESLDRLGAVVAGLRSGEDLPAFREALRLLG